jgi:cytochrome b subunit of formate dehydrogenase
MILHWLLDLARHLRALLATRPQVRRLRLNEVWQHTFLMLTFIALVFSGFGLRFDEGWLSELLFGWVGGFELRGVVHRVAAVLFLLTGLWHGVYLVSSRRGKSWLKDMLPARLDLDQLWQMVQFNLGRRGKAPRFARFSYVEKAEYWALVWGSVIMVLTGLLLWFDNWFIHYLPKGALDVALVIHYYEAWLATLAILVWHLYATVYSPHVYPMNPAWITGRMPEKMYRHEHPEHFEKAKREVEEDLKREIEELHEAEGDPTE